jgi:hypothetical protein
VFRFILRLRFLTIVCGFSCILVLRFSASYIMYIVEFIHNKGESGIIDTQPA